MQQPLRPRALRQPAAGRLPFNLDAQVQDSGAVAADDLPNRRLEPKPSEDISSLSSRLPAPIISRPHGDGGNTTGIKRRSMLPQLSPTKGYKTAPEAGKREHGRALEEEGRLNGGSVSSALDASNAADSMKNLPTLASPLHQSRKMGVPSDSTVSETRTSPDLEDAPLRPDTSTRPLDQSTYPIPTELARPRPRTLPQPRAVSAIVGPGSRSGPFETKGAGNREVIAKSAAPGRAPPPRPPTATAAMPAKTSRGTANWAGFPAAPARPRSMIISPGRDFSQEIRPESSTSVSSAKHTLLEKPDPKCQPPTNARHRRIPSTRSERATFFSKPKELERKDAIPPSGKALAPATTEQKRPAFSTLQQHFTPKKALKAPTSSYLATATGKSPSGEMSPETARLQAELLQLHLLHGPAVEVLHSWQESAQDKLRGRFEDIAQKHHQVAALERKTQAQLNLRALKEFAREDKAGQGLGERIQSLGSVILEIVNVTGAGGRYARLVRSFERWIEWVEQIWESRGRDGSAASSRGELDFVEGLGDGWRDETASLSRKLGFWLHDLDGVRSLPAGSSIALVIARCKSLTEGMLLELSTMRGMERAILVRESCWVSEKVTEILAEIDSSTPNTDGGRSSAVKQGIWIALR